LARQTINLLESYSILNALEQMRKASTHIAFVVNEFGDFVGVLTMTDILESIAGELPDASEIEGPDVIEEKRGFVVSGRIEPGAGSTAHRVCRRTYRRLSDHRRVGGQHAGSPADDR
jgi:hypothetical protein